jgi:EAL domain-containing protein (putative c-di-GMP-specific phosphodiesterase class I)
VIVAHIDGFGELVDAHCSEVTDALVASAADRLRSAMDPDAVVARTAADELAVLHVSDGGIEDFTDLSDRVRVALSAPFGVGGVRLAPTTSIGVSVRPATDTVAEPLVREAEAAAVRASGLGRGRTELYDHDLRRQARRRLDQASALRRAIDDDELVVVWQAALPLQPTEDDQPEEVWAEALVRWRNPERGLVSPGNFIALAEETGLIVPVGEAVLRMALAQLVEWRAAEGTHPRRVAVNLSPRQLAHEDLAESVGAALDEAGLEPAAVMFEVTESAVTAGPEDAIRRLNELRDLGVGLAMDDFGTGYSSLGYLRRMPVSVLKIDQSFIRGLTTHRADWAIVHGIVEMAHGIGLTVVAEGIETAEQLDHLVALGCDRGQGYFWSSPVPAEALDQLLVDWTPPGRRP